MSTIDVWVPLTGTGTRDDPIRPDVTVPYTTRDGIPSDLDPLSPTHGRPATQYALLTVREEDHGEITNAIDPDDVADEDKLLVELCRCRSRSGAMDLVEESSVESIFDRERHRAVGTDGRRTFASLLLQMVRRGLSVGKANQIADELGVFGG